MTHVQERCSRHQTLSMPLTVDPKDLMPPLQNRKDVSSHDVINQASAIRSNQLGRPVAPP